MRHAPWHIACVSTGRERAIIEWWTARGIEGWTPIGVYRRRLPRCNKSVDVQRTAFPGYIFLSHDAIGGDEYRLAPGFVRLLSTNGINSIVHDSKISEIKQKELNGDFNGERPLAVVKIKYIKGQAVIITEGPLAGQCGIVTKDGRIEVDTAMATIKVKIDHGALKDKA